MTVERGHVLLFEDSVLEGVLFDLLSDEGYAVTRCSSIQEVEDALLAHPGAVALCDDWSTSDFYVLSDEHRAEIKRLSEKCPLIMISGRVWAAHEKGDLGQTLFLGKPFDLDDLLAAVRVGSKLAISRAASSGARTSHATP